MIIVTNSNILGKNIRYLREKRGMTQQELVSHTGIEILQLKYLEEGQTFEIEAEELSAVCSLFGVDMDDIWKEDLQE